MTLYVKVWEYQMKAKEFIPASKPRNFVAKNQQTAGAGAHRDKKKEQKQGYEKHKGKGVSEGSYTTEKQILTRIRQILHDRKLSGTESNAGELHRLKQQLKDLRSQQSVAEGNEDPPEEEMDRTVSDLHKDVFGIRPSPEWGREWMSMSEQEKRDLYYQMVDMLDQQDVSEGYGNKEFEVDGYTYMTDLDREEDNQKIWHMIKTPDGKTVNVDFTPYEYMTKDDVELYVKLGMPRRQGGGPLDSKQLQKMAQIKGVAMLDRKMARAGL